MSQPMPPSGLQVTQAQLFPHEPTQNTANPKQQPCTDLTQSSIVKSSISLRGEFLYQGEVDDKKNPIGPGELVHPNGKKYLIQAEDPGRRVPDTGWRMMPPNAKPLYIAYSGGYFVANELEGRLQVLCSNGGTKSIRASSIWKEKRIVQPLTRPTPLPKTPLTQQAIKPVNPVPNHVEPNGNVTVSKNFPNGQTYVGGWLNNRFEGQGKLTQPDGFACSGEFKGGNFVKGKVSYPDKTTYEGSMQNGKFHGQGTLIKPNGSGFRGNFNQGVFQGPGVLKDQGRMFEGMFVKNLIVEGKLTYPNGGWYKGEFRRQCPWGMGERLWADKKTHFFGSWVNGFPLRGILTSPGGNIYSGEFLAGKPNGAGTLNYLNGDVYAGTFANGQPDGKGRLRYHDGRVYKGIFANGRPNGWGKLTYFDGTVKTGQFNNGEVQGVVLITYTDKATYTGPIENGEPHGDEGTLTFRHGETYTGPFFRGRYQTSVVLTDGRIYKGEFRNGIMDGIGRLELLDGSIYLGQFKNGLAHGFGVVERADGTAWTGNFEEGQPLPETGIEITKQSGSYASKNDPMDMQNTIYYELEELGYYWPPQE